VNTPDELQRQVRWLMDTYKRASASVLVEEFIVGSEFTVAVIGNDPPEAYPVCQIALDGQTELGTKFFHWAYLRTGSDYICPAPIPEALAKQMQELALRTYQAVDCRDFGRVDFRVDKQGRPWVLEINPLPSLSTEDVFNYIAKTKGLTHYQIINRILEAALARNGVTNGRSLSHISPSR
jgi:D-alanine-D-alanine ligase